MTIKWETLKKRAKKSLEGNQKFLDESALAAMDALREKAEFADWRGTAEEFRDEVFKYIDRWDIRCAMKLVKAFPWILPAKYHETTPCAEMNENSDWVLIFE